MGLHLAPQICPICQTEYQEKLMTPEFERHQYFHYPARRVCLVEDGRAPIQLRLMRDGLVLRDVEL